MIDRDLYLNKLIKRKHNGLIKIREITIAEEKKVIAKQILVDLSKGDKLSLNYIISSSTKQQKSEITRF